MEKGEEKDYNGVNNYMDVITDEMGSSHVKGTNHGVIGNSGNNGYSLQEDNPMSHEFGHFLGLRDKYVTDGEGNNHPISPKWNNDIMATPTDQKNRIISTGTLTNLFRPSLKTHKDVNKKEKVIHRINKYNREP